MTLEELRAACRKKTKTNETNYPDSDLDDDINLAYGKVFLMLQEAEGYRNTGGDFETIDFEDDSDGVLNEQDLGYNGEYPMPVGDPDENIPGAISILEAHINYGDGHKKAEIINRSALEVSLFSDDTAYYSQLKPKVIVYRDSYIVRPRNQTGETIDDGIKLLTIARQPVLEDDTDEPIFEKNIHELIAYEVYMMYCEQYPEKYNPITEKKYKELESQAISLYEARVPLVKRLRTHKEKW